MSITTSYVDGQVLKAENVTEIVTKINANETNINGLTTTKVDKVTGKSLISDTTITSLTNTADTSLHYHSIDRNRNNHTGTQSVSTIIQDANNRFVTDTEKSNWNGKIDNSKIGVVNGVAQLDNNGLVPSNQLPSYVDDVLEYTSNANFPTTGESGKIYLNTTTNLTYRWSGTVYVVISPSLALGETSTTAYSGDKGKATTDNLATHIADGVKHITSAERTTWNGKQNTITIPTLQTATLLNSWVDYSDSTLTAKFFKTLESIVHLRGSIKNGATGNPTLLFTLPEGYRPSQHVFTITVASSATLNAFAQINIMTDGSVYLLESNGYNAWVSLSSVSFPTF